MGSAPRADLNALGAAPAPHGNGPDARFPLAEAPGEADLERLILEHRSAIFSYFRARVLRSDDAEDLAQEVFLRWYRGQAGDQRPADRPWLLGIARNVLREHVRANAKRREVGWAELCIELEDVSERPVPQPFAAGHLPECLESLGQSARQAIDLHYTDGLRLAEIGERLERSEPAVRLLMFRSRQALRNCLERRLRAEART